MRFRPRSPPVLHFLPGFGLGGVIATFGLILDLIGFVLFLIFVLVSRVILLKRISGEVNDLMGPDFCEGWSRLGRRLAATAASCVDMRQAGLWRTSVRY